jgi:hypothetical protein
MQKKQLNNIIQKITELSKEDKAAFLDYITQNISIQDLININPKFRYINSFTISDWGGVNDTTKTIDCQLRYAITSLSNGKSSIDITGALVGSQHIILAHNFDGLDGFEIKGADNIYYTDGSLKLNEMTETNTYYFIHIIALDDDDDKIAIVNIKKLTQ